MSNNFGPEGWQPQPGQQPPPGTPYGPTQWQGQPATPAPPAQQWQPQAPGQPWQPQAPGQPWQGPAGPGWGVPPGPPKKKTGAIVTVLAVVLVLIAGGITTYFALRDGKGKDPTGNPTEIVLAGKDTPQQAAADFAVSISKRDTVGMLDLLDPTEARLFRDFTGDIFKELQRLEIIKPSVDANKLTDGFMEISNLAFDDSKSEQVNDHVTVVPLASATVKVTVDPTKLPVTDSFAHLLGTNPKNATVQTATVQINGTSVTSTDPDGKRTEKQLEQPFRIATVKRDGGWYPSVLYTIADSAVQEQRTKDPSFGRNMKPIPAMGASSPEEAVKSLFTKAFEGDWEGVITGLAPDEMGVLHDYGSLFIDGKKIGAAAFMPFNVSDVQFVVTDITGGKRVSLKSLTIEFQGQKAEFAVDGNTGNIKIVQNGQSTTLTPEQMLALSHEVTGSKNMDTALMARMIRQFTNLGIVTVNYDGAWYVSPLRTGSDLFISLLKAMEPQDVAGLLDMSSG